MRTEITLKNYRCFSDEQPARIVLHDGITALLGVNNSGKSSLLKFFYEFRPAFAGFFGNNVINMLRSGGTQGFGFPPEVFEGQEVFCNLNSRALEAEFDLGADLLRRRKAVRFRIVTGTNPRR